MTAVIPNRKGLPREAVSRATAHILFIIVFLAFNTASAQDIGFDVGVDSEIQLVERSEEGSYRFRTIVMQTRDGKTVITQVLDDSRLSTDLPFEAYEGIWRHALALELPSIEDAPLENAFPGQSEFEFLFRDGQNQFGFSAYAVDYLTDTRYRELARLILGVADKHLGDGGVVIE